MDLRCCENCFNDGFLKAFIAEKGNLSDCSYCQSTNVRTIPPGDLTGKFMPLFKLYECCLDIGMDAEEIFGGGPIWGELQNDWDIFAIGEEEIHERLLKDIAEPMFHEYKAGWAPEFTENVVFRLESTAYYEERNEEQIKLWSDFRTEILTQNRFFIKKSLNLDLIRSVLTSSKHTVESGQIFFRCRRGKEPLPPKVMGMPPPEKAIPGRANPIGIPYLYLSECELTCALETGMKANERGTLAEFEVLQPMVIANLANPRIASPFEPGEKLHNTVLYLRFLRHLAMELSKPVEAESPYLYTPTQYLCEFIKTCGYDGVQFRSSKTKKLNMTLFHQSKVKCSRARLFTLKSENRIQHET